MDNQDIISPIDAVALVAETPTGDMIFIFGLFEGLEDNRLHKERDR